MAVLSGAAIYSNTASNTEESQMWTFHSTSTFWIQTTTTIRGIPALARVTVYTTLPPVELASYPDPIMSATGADLSSLLSKERSNSSATSTLMVCGSGTQSTSVMTSSIPATTSAVASALSTKNGSTYTQAPMTQVACTTVYETTTLITTLHLGNQTSQSQLSPDRAASTSVAMNAVTSGSHPSIRTSFEPSSYTLIPWSIPSLSSKSTTQSNSDLSSFTDVSWSIATYDSPSRAPSDFSTSTSSTTSAMVSTTPHITTALSSATTLISISFQTSPTATITPPISHISFTRSPTANTVSIPPSVASVVAVSTSPTGFVVIPITPTDPVTLLTTLHIARHKYSEITLQPAITSRSPHSPHGHDLPSPNTPSILFYIVPVITISILLLIMIRRFFTPVSELDDLPYTTKSPQPGLTKRLSLSMMNIRRSSNASAASLGVVHASGSVFGTNSEEGEVKRTPSGLLLNV